MEAEISWVKVGGDGWSWQEGGRVAKISHVIGQLPHGVSRGY